MILIQIIKIYLKYFVLLWSKDKYLVLKEIADKVVNFLIKI